MALAGSSGAFCRPPHHARDLRGVGRAVLRNDGAPAAAGKMVRAIRRAADRRFFPAACLDFTFAAWIDLLFAVAVVFALPAFARFDDERQRVLARALIWGSA